MSAATVTEPAARATPFSILSILAPLTAIILGTFMAILDQTVVNVGLPTLERAFKADLHLIEWVITGYFLAQAAVIPLAGWLGDRFGARRLYITALVLFTAGSVLCAGATGARMLVLARVLQGLGGGILMPISMTFIYRLAPAEKRGVVMSLYGIPVLLGPTLGPLLGGWLIQYADWRYIFLINAPIGLLTSALALRTLPHMPAQQAPGRLDLLGAILGPIGFAALSYGISESPTAGWTGGTTLTGIALGILALVAFAVRELTCDRPLLELRVFRTRDFSLAILTQWTLQISLFAGMFLIPLFLQQMRGYNAFDTGLAMMPMPIAAAVFMLVGGRLFDRFGVRPLVIVGMLITTAATWLLAGVSTTTSAQDLLVPFLLRGIGVGLMAMALNTHVLNSAPPNLVSRVTSLTTALANIVASLTVASFATLLERRTATHVAAARRGIEAYAQSAAGAGHASHTVQQYATNALHHALALAYDDTFLVATALTVLGLLLGLTLRRETRAEQQEERESEPSPAELLAS